VRSGLAPWRILVVDDDPDIRALTKLNLRDFTFCQRPLEFIDADSAASARDRLAEFPDIAMALIDVVMETDDAGLELVKYIRESLSNTMMRLIIRTGQPGMAPERFVIDNYDIDDYKDKTELTTQKLYTVVRSALKSYRDLDSIEMNRSGLERILDATPNLYRMNSETLEEFFQGILTQVIALCKLSRSALITTVDGLVTTFDGNQVSVRAGTGDLVDKAGNPRLNEVLRSCTEAVQNHTAPIGISNVEAIVVPLEVHDKVLGFVYLEAESEIPEYDRRLIQVFANQCAAALENLHLHINLRESYEHALDMLALVAEYKDHTTGEHIRRVSEYARVVALELGMDPKAAESLSKASRLHDVGKIGIPDALLAKPGSLTQDEYEQIKKHPAIGADILSGDPAMSEAREIARDHHERYDGTGYPAGLSGNAIGIGSRIIAVIDVFDAMTSRRPYKDSWPVARAMKELTEGAGTKYDPRVVAAFSALHERGELDAIMAKVSTE